MEIIGITTDDSIGAAQFCFFRRLDKFVDTFLDKFILLKNVVEAITFACAMSRKRIGTDLVIKPARSKLFDKVLTFLRQTVGITSRVIFGEQHHVSGNIIVVANLMARSFQGFFCLLN